MEKTHMLLTLAFENTSEIENIDTTLDIKQDIIELLQNYLNKKKITHYVVADEEVISEKLKS